MNRRESRRSIRAFGCTIGIIVALAFQAGAEEIPQAEALLKLLERGPGPSKGDAAAPITLVEFSDFQCSYCRKFWRDTFPKIEEKYIRVGKVRYVYRHLAVLGPSSVEAAVAAACAHEQGKFWAYHDRLFGAGGVFAFREGSLKRYAADLGLDNAQFGQCVAASQTREKVEQETMVGHAIGLTGTPAFLINGGRLMGAQPYEVFAEIFDRMLQEQDADREQRQKP